MKNAALTKLYEVKRKLNGYMQEANKRRQNKNLSTDQQQANLSRQYAFYDAIRLVDDAIADLHKMIDG